MIYYKQLHEDHKFGHKTKIFSTIYKHHKAKLTKFVVQCSFLPHSLQSFLSNSILCANYDEHLNWNWVVGLSFKTLLQLENDNLKFKSTTFVSIDYVEEQLPYCFIALRVIIFPHVCKNMCPNYFKRLFWSLTR